MTTAPNIEMIASSLRRCSLHGGGRRRGGGEGGDASGNVTVELNSHVPLPYHWEQCLDIRTGQVYYINWEDGTRTTVDPRTPAFSFSATLRPISSPASPRSRCASTPSSGYTSVSSVGTDVAAWARVGAATNMDDSGYDNNNEDDDDDKEDDDDEDEDSSSTTTTSSCSSSSRGSAVSSALSSSFSPTDSSASGDNSSVVSSVGDGTAGHVLVAAGCRACFMYFMVPKSADVCPKCGSAGLLHLSRDGYA